MYEIEYHPDVKDSMKKFPKHDRKSIYDKIEDLKKEPRPSGIEPLQGQWKGYFRVRYGNYRIIYSIHNDKLLIFVVKVAKRGEVYKNA
ncbi:MAG: type II toxin-antitoxin system RelE/ParE family toxin [Chlamydiales bacterium]|nr:type II toxin-antitoxin system RelE/ParE family toxin [Chlamydiales bacterium]